MKKKLLIIGGGVLAAGIAAVVIFTGPTDKPPEAFTTPTPCPTPTATEEVLIDDPVPDVDELGTKVKTEKSGDKGIMPTEEDTEGRGAKTVIKKAPQTAKAVVPGRPEDSPDNTRGIVIDGGEAEKYDCGTAGHHCDGPETHAYIQNLELEGCPYCGKHDCKSFYAVDEWGNTCYTPSKCPKYDAHKDPACYCQTCGKKCGDGTNGTCVQFVNACLCPNCGERVGSFSCHSCK